MNENLDENVPNDFEQILELVNKFGKCLVAKRADAVCKRVNLHNITNTLRDIRVVGAVAWKKRMEKTENNTSAKQCWYYLGCLKALSVGWSNPIRDEFARSVVLLCELVGTAGDVFKAHKLAGGE